MCGIHMSAMTRSYVRYDSFIRVPWLLCIWTHSYVYDLFCPWNWCVRSICMNMKRDLYQNAYMRSYMWVMTRLYVRHGSFICLQWLIHTTCVRMHKCVMAYSYVRRDIFICAPWSSHDSFRCVAWLDCWLITHSHVRHDSFICANWVIHMCDMTHSYVRRDPFICTTRLINICSSPEIHQIQKLKFLGTNLITLKSPFEFVPRHTEESEFLWWISGI